VKSKYINKFICWYVRKYTTDSSVLLDIGCGRGQYVECTRGQYIGTDITTNPYAPDSPRNVAVVSSAELLPFADASLDAIMTVACFYQIPDPWRALSEFHRVLKPQGRVLIFDYNRRTQKRLSVSESCQRPCWSHNQLLKIVQDAGFCQCEKLIPYPISLPKWILVFFFPLLERLGSWAVVTGIKAESING